MVPSASPHRDRSAAISQLSYAAVEARPPSPQQALLRMITGAWLGRSPSWVRRGGLMALAGFVPLP
jgi:hypothetical protein